MSLVLLDRHDDGVRVVMLNDPDRRNALSPALMEALGGAVDEVAHDRDARVLVVTGVGKGFCAGADLPAVFGELDRDVADIRRGLQDVYSSFLRVRELPIPTIAAVQGAAVGAGVNLAMACDVRLAGPNATFGVTFAKLGIHPGGGCTFFLTQALGRQRALSLILDGAALTAREAEALGLVLDVVDDPVDEALARARRWAQLDPDLARDMKRAVGIAEVGGFAETLDFEAWAQAASTRSPALREAVARFRR
ncbi:MAG: enoyl-CoA hydratase [Jatrophihabitans sp.]|uniref:enoyl-CoA hydratase n=1 Tax=Jatrophihabitans sp. TaxID=1932789 RepID=UPI003F7E62C1